MAALHRHHWHIEKPDGPTSVGHCACGEQKLFHNGGLGAELAKPNWNAIQADDTSVTRMTGRTRRLLPEDVRYIRRRAAEGETHIALAEELGLSSTTVRKVVQRHTHQNIE